MSEPIQDGAELVRAKPAQGSKPARRTAALILEALGGLRSAPEAAEVLGIQLARYYVLERRAVQGMVAALEPRPRGRQLTLRSKLERAEREVARLEQEVLRYQALYRASQRAIGMPREEASATSKRKKATTRARRKKSRAEKLVPRLVPEESAKDAPRPELVSDASSVSSEEV